MSVFDLNKLRPGQHIMIDGKRYARCRGCNKVVRTDKPLFGDLHFCME